MTCLSRGSSFPALPFVARPMPFVSQFQLRSLPFTVRIRASLQRRRIRLIVDLRLQALRPYRAPTRPK